MKPFPLNLKDFKKVKESEHSTIFHSNGNKIEIAHAPLSQKLRKQLSGIPLQKMADGGEADLSDVIPPNSSQVASNDGDMASSSLGQMAAPQPTIIINNGKSDVQTPESSGSPPESVDSQLQAKRNYYNQELANNFDPAAKFSGPQYFGQNGEAPSNFSPQAWSNADARFQSDQKLNQDAEKAKELKTVDQITEENKARAAAGIPLLPVPKVSMGPEPTAQQPSMPQQGMQSSPSDLHNYAQPGAGQNQDLFGTQAYYDSLQKGIGMQVAGQYGAANALQKQGQAEAQAAVENQKQTIDLKQEYSQKLGDLQKEYNNFQQDIKDSHIDPNHYMNSQGTMGKLSTAMGLILGGAGGGLTHQENPALRFLNAQIDRDIQSQQSELGKKENLLSANLRQFGNLRDATEMTRAMQAGIYGNEIQKAAADAKGPLAKSNAQVALGSLYAQYAPTLSQIAMRQTMAKGISGGQIAPESLIRGYFPDQKQQEPYMKELASAQKVVKSRDNALSAWDQIQKLNTLGNRISSPLQTPRQVAALREPLLGTMTKDTEGRVTPTDIETMRPLFPQVGDDPATLQRKRIQFEHIFSAPMNFPQLQSIGINPAQMGKYKPQEGPGGSQKRIQLGPVVGMNGR